VAQQYDDFQLILEEKQKPEKYLNYGYSRRGTEPLEVMQAQLCREVFEAAEIEPDHVLVDVGFGSGEQDLLLAREHDFARLHGFNIAASQVAYANARAREHGLADRLRFHHGPSERMAEIEDGSVDRVLAIECAFYFDRPRFYAEAARILKPGGRVVLADICFDDRLASLTRLAPDLGRVGSLGGNRRAWERHLHTASIRNIRREVVPGSQRAVLYFFEIIARDHRLAHRRAWKEVLKMAISTQIVNLGFRSSLIRYDLIVLHKPMDDPPR